MKYSSSGFCPCLPGRFGSGVLLMAALSVSAPLRGSAQPVGQGRAMEVLQSAAERYDELEALCADFTQVRRVPLLDQVVESKGHLCHKDPNLFLMDFAEPDGDVVVADGTNLWIYYPSMDPKQVFRRSLDDETGRFDFHREFLANPGTKYLPEYEGTDSVEGHVAHVLRLVPRAASPYVEAKVWIDLELGLIRKVVITEENDSVREVILSQLRVDPELPQGAFSFTPPEGATVIRR